MINLYARQSNIRLTRVLLDIDLDYDEQLDKDFEIANVGGDGEYDGEAD